MVALMTFLPKAPELFHSFLRFPQRGQGGLYLYTYPAGLGVFSCGSSLARQIVDPPDLDSAESNLT